MHSRGNNSYLHNLKFKKGGTEWKRVDQPLSDFFWVVFLGSSTGKYIFFVVHVCTCAHICI